MDERRGYQARWLGAGRLNWVERPCPNTATPRVHFKFKREKSFTAAYNRIVAFITHYNEKLCTDIDSDSEGDDE